MDTAKGASNMDYVETPFVPLHGVNTKTATSFDDMIFNVKENIKRNLPRLHQLSEFHKVKGKNKKIALVGGGPSLKNYLDDIRQFRTIIACGSCNDYLVNNNITPTYAAICDPDPLSIKYYQKLDTETKYLIASCCHGDIFEHLKEQQVILWHCHSDEIEKNLRPIEENYQAIGGGCTIGLRAISIAVTLGYSNLHLFGFDSCLGDTAESHAYAAEDVGVIYRIKVGTADKLEDSAKTFYCAGYQLAQADHFRDFYTKYNHFFTPTIYGNGLLVEILKTMQVSGDNGVKNE